MKLKITSFAFICGFIQAYFLLVFMAPTKKESYVKQPQLKRVGINY